MAAANRTAPGAAQRAADTAPDTETAIGRVLADTEGAGSQSARLDLSPEFSALSSPVYELEQLARLAILVREDVLIQTFAGEQTEDHTVLRLLKTQISTLVWVIDQISYVADQASNACETLEGVLSTQNVRINVSRPQSEGRS